MLKDKEKNLKSSKRKIPQIVPRISVRLTDFSFETMETRGQRDGWRVQSPERKKKRKKCQPRILYPGKLSLKNEGKNKDVLKLKNKAKKTPQRICGQ